MQTRTHARPSRSPRLATLVLAAAVGTLAMTMYVPSIPSIAREFGVGDDVAQLGLSLFLGTMALAQLVAGPLSDLWGRRVVMLGALAVFVVGTVMCAWAPAIGWLLAGRVLQAASAAGMILSRTILRDLYPREKAASMIGYTVMAMAVAPTLGPWLGGLLDEGPGWRANLLVMGAVGAVALAAAYVDLSETNANLGRPLRGQFAVYRVLLRSRQLWLFIATGALTSAIYFGFLGGAAQVASEALGMTPSGYGAWFAFCAGGYVLGNYLSGRFAERFGLARMIVTGAAASLLGPLAMLASFAWGWNHPFALFGWIALVGVGNGMVLPSNVAAAVSVRPDGAGAASGLLGTVQSLAGALFAAATAMLVGAGEEPMRLVLPLVAAAAGALALAALSARALAREA